ncbi:pyrroline-5-carboxylate reductase [Flavobacterium amnicola]|uniref:Pyrroline-5-carboxylate reductase n=1 Tax=Flavobacterium amnicola TaxID=2506422 RepID=A0A4Q1K3K7_9FLAO|nr:pyrroline-5-carboxylate reductase [Flavobacterium amnicola]RXR19414.1 pyrroline-5-carboxylate reductase [Flavobacterium amnicola]
MKITIVGFGNIGKTFASSFITSRFIKAEDVKIISRAIPNPNEMLGIPSANFTTLVSSQIQESDIVLLAIKPQDFHAVADDLKKFVSKQQILFSVMAGVSIDKIKSRLGVEKVVRSMPNLGTQVGLGMSVFSASTETDRKDLFIIQNLINTTGKSIYVEDESLINPATAVSGSGPAYVFYFMNAMIKAAEDLGFNYSEAELLVRQTFLGAIHLQSAFGLSNEDLIAKVASKGGTTESALRVFENHSLGKIINAAIVEANLRAIELGN